MGAGFRFWQFRTKHYAFVRHKVRGVFDKLHGPFCYRAIRCFVPTAPPPVAQAAYGGARSVIEFRATSHGPLKEYAMREAEPFRPRRGRLRGSPPKPPVRQVLAPSDYPDSDGKPMAETPVHWHATYDATCPLHWFFEERSDVYVGSDMFVYYVEDDPRRSVVPDVWVAFGVPKLPERRSWLTWLEGKGPDFVLEITSKSTKREDEVRKKKLYEELGVKEYWQFDPTGDYLDPILKGRVLRPEGKYRDLVLEERDGALRHPSLLGLELCLEGERLYYFDPENNVRLLAPEEERNGRHKAEEAARVAEKARQSMQEERDREARLRRQETAARQAAEARIAELERQLGA